MIDDKGAKALIAAVLKKAYDDYQIDKCPGFCEYIDTCKNKHDSQYQCDARNFIHGGWCETLCAGIDIDHDKYVELTIKKARIERPVYKYVEAEIRAFHESKKEIVMISEAIIHETQPVENKGGKSLSVGMPTESKAIKICNDRKLARLERVVSAIQSVYDASNREKKELVKLKYWNNTYKDEGIAIRLGVDRATLYRWNREFVLKVAVKLGYL